MNGEVSVCGFTVDLQDGNEVSRRVFESGGEIEEI